MKAYSLKKIIYWTLIAPIAVFLLLEFSLYALVKGGLIKSEPREILISKIQEIRSAYLERNQSVVPIHVPHPYFGNLYNPSKTLNQYTFNMTFDSNSDGFIDDEFPTDRKEGECIYGLLGGSAALSLGVKNKEDRISSQLQKLLNIHSRNQRCKHYRVLNMAIGGGLQIQSSFIYLYYWRLLNGVIFYVGNNECSIGSRMGSNTPIQFPIADYLSVAESVIKPDSAIKLRSFVLASFNNALLRFALKNKTLFKSNVLKVIYTIQLNRFENLKREMDEEMRKNAPDFARFVRKHNDPGFDDYKFLYEDVALQQKVMKVVLPLIYTDPIIQANAVAKINRSPVLLVIQPMLGASNKQLTAEEVAIRPFPLYQRTCTEMIKEEGKKLSAYGIVTNDLNRINLFRGVTERVFNDPSHVNELGNRIVASYLHQLILKHWHGSSRNKIGENAGPAPEVRSTMSSELAASDRKTSVHEKVTVH